MSFEKVGTPTPVSSVTASCKCATCKQDGICILSDGQYLCQTCLAKESHKGPSDGVEGQNGVL